MKNHVETTRRIKQLIVEEPTITQTQIANILEEEGFENQRIKKLSQSSLSIIIKKLGYKFLRLSKAPVNRNTELARKKRVIWGETFIRLAKKRVQFVFIDESGFHLGMTRTRGYAPVGSTPEVVVEKIRNPNHTAIAALIVGYPMYVEVISGACDNEKFQVFCTNLIRHLRTIINANKTVVVVMDNASIHRRNVFNIFWENHIYVLMTIPYSPQCNAVELAFSEVKSILTRMMGSRFLFAAVVTDIYEQRIIKEYERRIADHLPPATTEFVTGDIEALMIMNPLYRRFQEWLEQTDQWFIQEMERSRRTPSDVNPLTDRHDDELFHEIIMRCFRGVTSQQSFHYYAHTIKVAHSCTKGYPLSNSSQFYHRYNEMDEETDRLYKEYAEK